MHSFDVDLGERLSIHESDWFEHGNRPITFKTGKKKKFQHVFGAKLEL
jgi:hypothetical protein